MKLNFKKLFVITIIGAGIFISQQLHAFMGYDYYMDPTNLPSDTLRENVLYLWKEKSEVETFILF